MYDDVPQYVPAGWVEFLNGVRAVEDVGYRLPWCNLTEDA